MNISKEILQELKDIWGQWDIDASWEMENIGGNIQYGFGMQKCADDLWALIIKIEEHNE